MYACSNYCEVKFFHATGDLAELNTKRKCVQSQLKIGLFNVF